VIHNVLISYARFLILILYYITEEDRVRLKHMMNS